MKKHRKFILIFIVLIIIYISYPFVYENVVVDKLPREALNTYFVKNNISQDINDYKFIRQGKFYNYTIESDSNKDSYFYEYDTGNLKKYTKNADNNPVDEGVVYKYTRDDLKDKFLGK